MIGHDEYRWHGYIYSALLKLCYYPGAEIRADFRKQKLTLVEFAPILFRPRLSPFANIILILLRIAGYTVVVLYSVDRFIKLESCPLSVHVLR